MPKIISVINFKGGVGKTTVSVNVAACMAHKYGKKVLLVDLDPQSNASIWMLGEARWQDLATKHKKRNIAGIMLGWVNPKNTVETPFRDPGTGRGLIPQLDVIPAVYWMFYLEDHILRSRHAEVIKGTYKKHDEYRYLQKTLLPFLAEAEYDAVILDCPPNMYNVSKNAIFISHHYVVPCIPDTLSTIGLKQLLDQVEEFAGKTKAFGGSAPSLLGVLINRFEGPGVAETPLEDMEGTLRTYRNKPSLTVRKGSKVLSESPIRRYNAHQYACESSLPVCLFSERHPSDARAKNAASDIAGVTEQIMKKAGLQNDHD
ncbi:MAG: ParA family protein [Thermodesulfobacteriota bacterium]